MTGGDAERVRAFLAIDVDEASSPERPTVAPSHLTLRFFRELDPERLPALEAVLRDVARREAPFELTLDGVGAFPSRSDPRVVWIGVTAGRAEVFRLAGAISDAIATLGVPPEAPNFEPHLTLFRVRSTRDRTRARGLLDGSVPSPAPRQVAVRAFVLKESTLTPAGPVHRPIGRFLLGGARRTAG